MLHALALTGSTGDYGWRLSAVGSPIHSVRIAQFDHNDKAPFLSEVITERGRVPLAPFLADSDIVVNCTLQDPNAPLTYLLTEDLDAFRPGSAAVPATGNGVPTPSGSRLKAEHPRPRRCYTE